MTHLLIAGKTGRMAISLLQEAQANEAFTSVENFGRGDSPDLKRAHLMIDFSTPEALNHHLALLRESHCALLVGTTGLTPAQMNALQDEGQKRPVLYAANTGLGIPLLQGMLKGLGKALGNFNCRIDETHHIHKKDAPSGTALALEKALKDGHYEREILIESHRLGDVIGEHTLTFSSPFEEITITHRALDRRLFAQGALQAGLWLKDQKPGLYIMEDFLGI